MIDYHFYELKLILDRQFKLGYDANGVQLLLAYRI